MGDPVRLHMKRPGLQTLVEDGGRYGYEAYGVPNGGPMDRTSAQMANWLVGNSPHHPVLEITLIGPEIELEGDCQVALTGADLSPELNGKPLEMFRTTHIKNGSKLSFGPARSGCRAYLAIGGEWNIQSWLGSTSAFTFLPELTPGSQVTRGSQLEISVGQPIAERAIPKALQPKANDTTHVKVLPGPEFSQFPKRVQDSFFNQLFTTEIDSNRMGYRLMPELNTTRQQPEVISSGVIPGTIQVTNSGQPIILMADAQTSGGYPRIGNVISAHQDRLAQVRPGQNLRFSLVDLKEAYQALKDEQGFLRQVMT